MSEQRATKSVPVDAAAPAPPEPAVTDAGDGGAGLQGSPSHEGAQMGTFDEAGKYTPRQVVADRRRPWS